MCPVQQQDFDPNNPVIQSVLKGPSSRARTKKRQGSKPAQVRFREPLAFATAGGVALGT